MCLTCYDLREFPQALADQRERTNTLADAFNRCYDPKYRQASVRGIVASDTAFDVVELLAELWYRPDSTFWGACAIAETSQPDELVQHQGVTQTRLSRALRKFKPVGKARKVTLENNIQAVRDNPSRDERMKMTRRYVGYKKKI